MKKHKIAVVNSSTFGRHFPDLMERLEELGEVKRFDFRPDIGGKKLARELSGYEFIIASVTPDFTSEFFKNHDEVKLLARHGIGCDNVDLEAAIDSGVLVTRVKGSHERDAVAELTLSLIMSCLRDIVHAVKAVEDDKWKKRRMFVGRELSKMKVGIIGYGNIGSRTAEIIKEGFGSEVMAYDPNIADAVIEKNGIKSADFDEVLRNSDLISLHASLNEDNYHLIGREEFEIMKEGVIIVNTARGELMVEEELSEAVKSGKVAAVGLDVAEREPIPRDNSLLDRDNVLILSHIGSYTEYSLRKMDEKMVEDIETYLQGGVPEQVANPKVLR